MADTDRDEEPDDAFELAEGEAPKEKDPRSKRIAVTPERAEELQKRIFDLKMHGMTNAAIAKIVSLDTSTVRYHLKKARLRNVSEIEESGAKGKIGEFSRKFQRAQEVAWFNISKAPEGSVARAIWLQTYLKAVKDEGSFLMETGWVPKASDKLDISLVDARSMSLEELENECRRLERRLSGARIIPDVIKEITSHDVLYASRGQGTKTAIARVLEAEAKITRAIDKDTPQADHPRGEGSPDLDVS